MTAVPTIRRLGLAWDLQGTQLPVNVGVQGNFVYQPIAPKAMWNLAFRACCLVDEVRQSVKTSDNDDKELQTGLFHIPQDAFFTDRRVLWTVFIQPMEVDILRRIEATS